MTDKLSQRLATLPEVIAIVGSRGPDPERGRLTGWTDGGLIVRIVRRFLTVQPTGTIVSGGARSGVDHMVAMTCKVARFCDAEHIRIDPTSVDCRRPHFIEILAEWHGPDGKGRLNRQAGFERNDKVVRHVSMVVALFAPGPKSPGTSDTVEKAHLYDVPVLTYHEGVWANE